MNITKTFNEIKLFFKNMPQYQMIGFGAIAIGVILIILAILLW